MTNRNKKIKRIITSAVSFALCITMAGCTQTVTDEELAEKFAREQPKLTVYMGDEPESLDPALYSTESDATILAHLFSGLAIWDVDEEGNPEVVPDIAAEFVEPVTNPNGTYTYTYELREDVYWSDGVQVSAKDFVYAWNRVASVELVSENAYLFGIIKGYDKIWSILSDDVLEVYAPDEHTLRVITTACKPEWEQMLASPAFFPLREDIVQNEGWETTAGSFVSNGRYILKTWEKGESLTLKKNRDYYDSENVTASEITFVFDSESEELPDFAAYAENDDEAAADGAAESVGGAENGGAENGAAEGDGGAENGATEGDGGAENGDAENGGAENGGAENGAAESDGSADDSDAVKTVSKGAMGTFYLAWNVNSGVFDEKTKTEKDREEIRKALSMMIDRNGLAEDAVGNGTTAAASIVGLGVTDYDGTQFCDNSGEAAAGANADTSGEGNTSEETYEDRKAEGLEILKKYYTFDSTSGMFTDFPEIRCVFSSAQESVKTGDYLKESFGEIGITLDISYLGWKKMTEEIEKGEYDAVGNSWTSDFDDPAEFLENWMSDEANEAQLGSGDHGKYRQYSVDLTDFGENIKSNHADWAGSFDVTVNAAGQAEDEQQRSALLHYAESILLDTGCVCPLWHYMRRYEMKENLENVIITPVGSVYFMYATRK